MSETNSPISKATSDVPAADPRIEVLERYKRIRPFSPSLAAKLAESLNSDEIGEAGRKLGILRNGVLELDTEDQSAVLMDYAIFDVRRNGLNAVDRMLAENPPPPGSDELILLQAHQHAFYAMIVVESVDRGYGVHVRDLLTNRKMFVSDISFSTSARPGAVLATRLTEPAGMVLTTGAGLPVGEIKPGDEAKILADLRRMAPGVDFANPTKEKAGRLSAVIIQACFREGASLRIRYEEFEKPLDHRASARAIPTGVARRNAEALPSARRAGRNDVCPCGSGKKYKRCCGS